MQIKVSYSPSSRKVHEVELDLPHGATVLDALQASGLQALYPGMHWPTAMVGVWGRKTALLHELRELDRVEIYRPLRVDPKVARRERFARQGARSAGLFANKRAGAKTGY
jgi:putative ubiquitin-RnfH superfamily antitoxin RatB of RatAB toxin-antitoxin module